MKMNPNIYTLSSFSYMKHGLRRFGVCFSENMFSVNSFNWIFQWIERGKSFSNILFENLNSVDNDHAIQIGLPCLPNFNICLLFVAVFHKDQQRTQLQTNQSNWYRHVLCCCVQIIVIAWEKMNIIIFIDYLYLKWIFFYLCIEVDNFFLVFRWTFENSEHTT